MSTKVYRVNYLMSISLEVVYLSDTDDGAERLARTILAQSLENEELEDYMILSADVEEITNE